MQIHLFYFYIVGTSTSSISNMPPIVSTKLYIGNLPETCRRVELQGLFEQYGKVIECDIVRNYAFVVRILYLEYPYHG